MLAMQLPTTLPTPPPTCAPSSMRMAPETVSRVLRRLSDEGVIAVNQREMLLLQPERLAELAVTRESGLD